MTKKHPHKIHHLRPRLLVTALAAALSAGITQAQVSVPSTVNFNSGTGIYTYSYSVLNNGPTFDLAILNVPVAPGGNLMNLSLSYIQQHCSLLSSGQPKILLERQSF